MIAIAYGQLPAELHQPSGLDVEATCRLPQARLTLSISMHVMP